MASVKRAVANLYINRLTTGPASVNLKRYYDSLTTDRDKQLFLTKVYTVVDSVATPQGKQLLREVVEKNDSIGLTRAKYEFAQIEQALAKFLDPQPGNFTWNVHFQEAVKMMERIFQSVTFERVVPTTNEGFADLLTNAKSHAGVVALERADRHKKSDFSDEYIQLFDEAVERGQEYGNFGYPIVVLSRTQASEAFQDDGSFVPGKYKNKSRLVNAVSLPQILVELTYAKSVQKWLGQQDFYAGGKNQSGIGYVINNMVRRYNYGLSIDYSSFDATIPSWLIQAAFDIIGERFSKSEDFDTQTWNAMVNSFIYKGVLMPDGVKYLYKGIPSGSQWTQIIGTMCNTLMVWTYMAARGIKDFKTIAMGDDNYIATNRRLDVEDLASYLNANFGTVIHPDKLHWTDHRVNGQRPNFLSREWTTSGCWRQPRVLLSRLLYPDHWSFYDDHDAVMRILCYIHEFKLGMQEIIDFDKVSLLGKRYERLLRNSSEMVKHMSGSARYQHVHEGVDFDDYLRLLE